MAQYTNTFTAQNGIVTNSVLDTVTNTQTITVTAPTGQVATATVDPTDINSNFDNIITNLSRQLNEGGGDIGLRGIVQGVQSTSASVAQQQQTATGVSRVTGNPPPAFTQPIPAQTIADPQVPQPTNTESPPTTNTAEPAEDPYAAAIPEDTPGPTEADLNVDPLSDEAILAQEQAQADNRFDLEVANVGAEPLAPEEDPFEATRLQREEEFNNQEPAVFGPTPVDSNEDTEAARADLMNEIDAAQDANLRELLGQGTSQEQAASQAATIAKAKEQATLAARYKSPANADWRVRLILPEGSDFLYKADPPGILKPLAQSNGVVFPYTPQIQTSYSANYEQYDLVHSNYRGYFYKNSKVGDITINAVFTAQDTQEAQYLLAVIHFFRSVTKMFYGKDAQRGAPPPIVYLVGLGDYQFNGHPCLVSNFTYNLPNDVDYIRANNPNNYGTNMLNRVSASTSTSNIVPASINRLANAIDNFGRSLQIGALSSVPVPGTVPGSVNNLNRSTYVPTKMEINITLLPVQTRAQVSKQFSLKSFANGQGLKGGFW